MLIEAKYRRALVVLIVASACVAVLAAGFQLRQRGSAVADCAVGTTDQPRSPSPPSMVGRMDLVAVRAALRPVVESARLGDHRGVVVSDLAGTVVSAGDDGTYAPASTAKLLTAFAALRVLDKGQRFETKVVLDGTTAVIVGGGDPLLVSEPSTGIELANVADLARQAAHALASRGLSRVHVGFDASLFIGPGFSPAWDEKYRDDTVAPISALWVDHGLHRGGRDVDPPRVAAEALVRALGTHGIEVMGEPREVVTGSRTELATVRSATVLQVVQFIVNHSDTMGAEVLLRHVASAGGEPPTFAGGAQVVVRELRDAGIDTAGLRLCDGSGLSRHDRVRPEALVGVLVAAANSPETAGLIDALPVAGVDGTLVDRFLREPAATGKIRAKTGTLAGVHALAGMAITADGHRFFFAVMADDAGITGVRPARASIDAIAAALVTCDCGR